MSNLPVIADEVASFETRLGIQLPEHYKASLLDERIRRILSSKTVGFLHPGHTMAHFADLTETLRRRHPEFPRAGVVLSCGIDSDTGDFNLAWGYLRFLLPDKKVAARLGDTVYAWDLRKRRQSRDCTIQVWIGSSIDCADDELTASLGIRKPRVHDDDEPLRTRSCDPDLMAALALRGDAAQARLSALGERWLPCVQFELKGSFVSIVDLGQSPDPRRGVRLPPGRYEASVKLAASRLGDWPIVSKLRLVLPHEGDALGLERIGDVDVDLAAIAIFDRQVFLRKFPVDRRDAFALALADVTLRPCLVESGKGTDVLVVPAGDGDGTYPLHALSQGGSTIGIEVHFTAPDGGD